MLIKRLRSYSVALLFLTALAACSGDAGADVDPDQVDAVEQPELGACRVLSPDDVAKSSNATKTVDCAKPHTAETFAVGALPESFDDVDYDDKALGKFAYQTCSENYSKFLGADDSLVMRTVLSWAWFRPSEKAWDDGARWYRCDVIGGGDQSKEYVNLPATTRDLMLGKPNDKWMVCADGASVAGSVKVPCSEPHTWRAVTTIKVGADTAEYPGDRLVEVKSRDFCSKSVVAWLNYPPDYQFGYTWFHEAEWEAGNRRSVCWAKTTK
ncbi:septum formation family protein [Nocardioides sp. Bht2]|uniref:septum formation family protein n=1 Tax=Nocardioides sp. Bht2 TaxID=3392297 RepID=UPI0039B6265E